MLYVVVIFEENDSAKASELKDSILNLNLPVHPMPPAYLMSFTGSAKELGHILGLNNKDGPKGLAIKASGFYLSSHEESGVLEWMNKHLPNLFLVVDE